MAEQRAQFESELKRRLSLKSTNEEHYLVKAFQYYDMNSSQSATMQQFNQVLEKLNIQLPRDQMSQLYEYYRVNGRFDYKAFASRVLQQPEQIVFYFQRKLIEGGASVVFALLERICTLPSRECSQVQFKSLFQAYPEDKVMNLFNYFDMKKQRTCNIDDVVSALRGQVASKQLVGSPQQLIECYRGDKHQLRRYIDIYMRYRGIESFDQRAFDEFNGLLNAEQMWDMDSSYMPTPAKKLDFNNLDLSEAQQLLIKRGPKAFVNLRKQLLQADDDQDGYLNEKQAQRVFRNYNLPIQLPGVQIDQFFRDLLEPFHCSQVAHTIFDKLDHDFDDQIPYALLKQVYNAKNHPDVRSRQKSENEVLAEFLDAYDAHHNQASKVVKRQEFIDFCHILYTVLGEKFEGILCAVFQYTPPVVQNSQVSQYAPFGTSAEKTDYSTNLRPSSGTKQQSTPAGMQYGYVNQPTTSIGINDKLRARGFRGLIYMLRQIQRYDAQGIYKGLESVRIQCHPDYVRQLLNNRSEISMSTFITKLVGEFPQWRLNLVDMAYRKLKSTVFEDMNVAFLARPRKGMTDEEVLIEFLGTFEAHHQLFRTNQVSLEEFQQYYHLLSFTIIDDREFELAVKSGWYL